MQSKKIQIKNKKWWINRWREIKNRIEIRLMGNAGSTVIGDIGEVWLVESIANTPSNSPVLVIAESSEKLDGVEIQRFRCKICRKILDLSANPSNEFERKISQKIFQPVLNFYHRNIQRKSCNWRCSNTTFRRTQTSLITNENEDWLMIENLVSFALKDQVVSS